MTTAPRTFAMLCFDKQTNELIMQAEKVESRPLPLVDTELDDFRPWDDRRPLVIHRPPLEAVFRFHFDETSGCAVRRIFTRAEQAHFERLRHGVG
ncbi:hypothetical protein SEA_DATBOI_8 [Gordonia phage DatBoi]|nr:hypothetical protein SEA_DATBOI_8 [Gordonia phage DatBoi]